MREGVPSSVTRSEHEVVVSRLWPRANARTQARNVCGLVLIALAVGACGRHTGLDRAPSACVDGLASHRVAELRAALAKAPGAVALPDGTRISDCLAHDSDSGDIETVGSMLLGVTQQLADKARRVSTDPTLTELGYLIGAAHRGAARAQGVADELVRRLDQELQGVDVRATAYRTGERAGRTSG